MKKYYLILFALIVGVSCNKKDDTQSLEALTGQAKPAAPVAAAPAPQTAKNEKAVAAADVKDAKGNKEEGKKDTKENEKNTLEAMKAVGMQEFYNPSGKRDPFKPFEGGEIIYSVLAKAPLERFELNQLQLTAIVWGIARPKVLFRAPDGYSYIAQVGTGVGRNRGKITKVTRNRVLISEEFRDPSGQYVARESEFQMDEEVKTEKLFQELELKYSDQ